MADHHQSDIRAHEAAYHGMVAWLKWGTMLCFIIAAIVIWLIAS